MKLKTEDGKYFSEIGSWSNLIRIFFLVIVFKIFGIIGTVIAAMVIYLIIPELFKKSEKEEVKN